MASPRAIALASALVLAIVLLAGLTLRERVGVGPLHNPTDFVAFYCGGKVAAAGHDPYRSEPLRGCERAAFAESGIPLLAGLVVPAPLPGWTLAFFAPFGALSFRVAALVWVLLLAFATVASAALLVRTSRVNSAAALVSFASAGLYASLVVGQLVPFVVLALVGAGVAIGKNRPWLAGACAAAMLIEPHLGLPACLAVFTWMPRARLAVLVGIVVSVTVGIAFVGIEPTLEYLRVVLPTQARGEGLEFYGQYGLSAALHAAGVAGGIALTLGSLSYAAMVVLGVALARHAARRFDEPGLIVYVPVAFALVGGAYVHIYQMAAALPLALVLAARLRTPLAYASLACIAIPWQTFFIQPAIAGLFPAPPYIDPQPLLASVAGPHAYATDVWTQWMRTASNRDHRTTLEVLFFKLPTWFALGTFVVSVVAAVRQSGRKRLAPR